VGKAIQVTSAQVNAARLWIERADGDGTAIPEAIRKLAQAKPRPVVRETPMPDGPAETSDGAGFTGGPVRSAADDDPDDV
jgi:hypothetical protein